MAQVDKPAPIPQEMAALASSAQILSEFFAARAERREAKREAGTALGADSNAQNAVADSVRKRIAPHYVAQVAARVRVASLTSDSFHERLVQFWSNHFSVSVDKPICLGIAGAFENEAIRPNVTRRFVDLLLAAEHHPAMLAYLDNEFSVGPDSELAARTRRRTGPIKRKLDINENLAREILELHTLSVHGGYSQADVTTFARVLTGWSIGGGNGALANGSPGQFVFRENLHEPGAKTLLARTYAQEGEGQGVAVLEDLALHPATARHLATKLVRHFISDEPPSQCVERIAHAYAKSGGELRSMYAALIDCDQAWRAEPAKFKTAQDFVYSTYRALDFVPSDARVAIGAFDRLGQRPFAPGSPAGWADSSSDWDGADALMRRIEWSQALGDRIGSTRDPAKLAAASLGPLLSESTARAIRRAASAGQGLALLWMSPEFQRR